MIQIPLVLAIMLAQDVPDKLPEGAVLRLGDPAWRHADAVTSGDFSKDRRTVVTGSLDRTIRFWDVETGRELRRIELDDNRGVLRLRLAPDGEKIIVTCIRSGGGCTPEYPTHVVDVKTGRKERTLGVDAAGDLAISPDGKYAIAGSSEESVTVVRIADGKVVHTLRVNPERPGAWRPTRVACSRDGRRIAGSSDWGVRVWDLESGTLEASVKASYGGCLAFAPDGESIVFSILPNGGGVASVRALDWKGRVHDVVELRRSPEHLGFNAKGTILEIYDRENASSYDWRTHEEVRRLRLPDACAFAPEMSLAVVGSGADVEVWDLALERRIGGARAPRAVPRRVIFTADGRWLATCERDLRVWDLKTGALARQIWHGGSFLADALPAIDESRIIAARYSGKLEAFDGPGWERAAVTPNPDGGNPGELSWMPDGRTIVHAGRIGNVTLYRASDLQLIRHARIPYDGNEPPEVATVAGGLIVFRVQHEAIIVDAAEARILSKVAWTTEDWRDAAASPSGDLVVLHERGELRFVDPRTGAIRARVKAAATALAFSPDGSLLAAGDDTGTVGIIEVATGGVLLTLTARGGRVAAISFSSDLRRLAAAYADTTILLWDLARDVWQPERDADAWEALAGEDPLRAHGAAMRLTARPADLLKLVEDRTLSRPTEDQIRAVVRKFESEDVEVRSEAAAELERLGAGAGPTLRRLLSGVTDTEVRVRVEAALRPLETELAQAPEARRGVRLAAILFRLDTIESRKAIRRMAAEGLTLHEIRLAASAARRLEAAGKK